MYSLVLVDDEPWMFIDFIKSFDWESCGISITHKFTNPLEALDCIIQDPPDVVVTDVRMPELNGIELIKRSREAGVKSEFAIISGYSDFEFARQGIRIGVTDYLLKPLSMEALSEFSEKIMHTLDEKNRLGRTNPPADKKYSNSFGNILKHIDSHLSEDISLNTTAVNLFMNKNYICQMFNKNLNTTFSNYVTSRRVERAKQLLKESTLSIEEISRQVGFRNLHYFFRVFKRLENASPGEFRKSIRT